VVRFSLFDFGPGAFPPFSQASGDEIEVFVVSIFFFFLSLSAAFFLFVLSIFALGLF